MEEEGGVGVRRFYKFFFPEHHSHRLEIPPGYRRYARDLALGTVSLIGMSGHTWEVELAEAEGRLFFQASWADFVRDHDLRSGEFLVFEYEGRCRFSVLVFDHDCCEKEGAFESCPLLNEASEVSEEIEDGEGEVDARESQVALVTIKDSGKKKRGRKPLGCGVSLQWEPGADKPSRGKRVLLSHRRPVTKEEIERTEAMALAFRSSNPYVVVVLRRSSVYTGYMLNIPNAFAKVHLPKEGRSLRLVDPAGRVWPVTYVSTYGYFFSGGWRRFSIGNHLEEHDACVFELIEPRTIQVHIFRVVEEHVPKTLQYVEVKDTVAYQMNDGPLIRHEP